ncbi:hypothetical protein FPOAC2_04391 [Fusarium poae]
MGNPLSNNASISLQTLPKLTLENLKNIKDGPDMMANAMQEQNHEKVALGIPTVPKETNTSRLKLQEKL